MKIKKIIIKYILNYRLCISSIKTRFSTLKIFFIYDYHYILVFLQLSIIYILFIYYKHLKKNPYNINFKFKKQYKNLKWIPEWAREILKDKRLFVFYRVTIYIYNILKYFKCILEYKWLVLVLNHYYLAIFIKYIAHTIVLFLCTYFFTKLVSYSYFRFNGEVILNKYLNNLDFKFRKLKTWFSKLKI